jgi:hypothetical protein
VWCWYGCKLLPRQCRPCQFARNRQWVIAPPVVSGWLVAPPNQLLIRNLHPPFQRNPTRKIKFPCSLQVLSLGHCRKIRWVQNFLPPLCRCRRRPRRFTREIAPCFSDSFLQTPVVCLESAPFGYLAFLHGIFVPVNCLFFLSRTNDSNKDFN